MRQFTLNNELCVKCGECVRDCLRGCLILRETGPEMTPEGEQNCFECQHCLAVCPTGAISILGQTPKDSTSLKGLNLDPEAMLTLMKGRRSVRHYRNEAISGEHMAMLEEALASAPTGVNNRGLMFTFVKDPAQMEILRQRTIETIRAAKAQPDYSERVGRYEPYMDMMAQGADSVYRNAPQMVVVTVDKNAPTHMADPFIALSYFELLANALGIGTVWCGVAKAVLFDLFPELGATLKIPETQKLGYVMMFGPADIKYRRTVERGPGNSRTVSFE